MRALLLLALAGCPAKRTVVENIALPPAGTTLAVYLGKDPGSAIALIDDRQHVAVANHAILLDRIEPGSHPILIERPIVFANGRAAIGRPPESVLAIL